jgi:small-conductance mechanosensitive channel
MTGIAAPVIQQAVIPMAAFYLILMTALGIGLLLLQRRGTGPMSPAGQSGRRSAGPGSPRRGWPALIRHALGTAAGGYLLLLAVVTGYYYAIARVGGHFLTSAVTGFALLIALALPVFAARSWLAERAHRRDRAAPGDSRRQPR